jgi:hypothetical protein
MTTPHERALEAANDAYCAAPEDSVIAMQAAISVYLSSIGGVVCQREPAGYATELELKQLKLGVTVVDLFRNGVTDSSVVPLHAPISRSEEGSDKL